MMLRILKLSLLALLAAGSAECSDKSPEQLGEAAARAEMAYYVFNKNRDAHAATFMKSWVDACKLAGNDNMSELRRSFVKAYVKALQSEAGAATRKPLQTYVRNTWWKSGTGCETIERETPEWALK
jgi:hypothetical protein